MQQFYPNQDVGKILVVGVSQHIQCDLNSWAGMFIIKGKNKSHIQVD